MVLRWLPLTLRLLWLLLLRLLLLRLLILLLGRRRLPARRSIQPDAGGDPSPDTSSFPGTLRKHCDRQRRMSIAQRGGFLHRAQLCT